LETTSEKDHPGIRAAAPAYEQSIEPDGPTQRGTFRISTDGRATFDQRFKSGGEELIRISGMRISRASVPE
jgi:hypothetical protein